MQSRLVSASRSWEEEEGSWGSREKEGLGLGFVEEVNEEWLRLRLLLLLLLRPMTKCEARVPFMLLLLNLSLSSLLLLLTVLLLLLVKLFLFISLSLPLSTPLSLSFSLYSTVLSFFVGKRRDANLNFSRVLLTFWR